MIPCKLWKAGTGTLVITIPKAVKELYNLKEGDIINVDIQKTAK